MSRCPECLSKHECAEWCGESPQSLFDSLSNTRYELEQIRAKLDKAISSLEFYGDDENWKEAYYGELYPVDEDDEDQGEKARKTLKEIKE